MNWKPGTAIAGTVVLWACTIISVQTHAYLGSPRYPPTKPAAVQILSAESIQAKERLSEVILSVEGNLSQDRVEMKWDMRGEGSIGTERSCGWYGGCDTISLQVENGSVRKLKCMIILNRN